LAIAREIGNRQHETLPLANLGFVAAVQGDYAGARSYYEQCLDIVCEIGHRELEGYVLTGLGDALMGLGKLAEALVLLRQAISVRRELGHQALLMESQATLARAYLAQGDPATSPSASSGQVSGQTGQALTQAQAQVEEILAYLDAGGNLDGTEQPLRIYLTCYQVLQASGDSRAAGVLQSAHAALQEQAARIPDEDTRRSFLENVPWHREIVAAWQAAQHDNEEKE
ncbi:MAG: tetratricopeptide repeat protein, partial [Aestuariibacter sp.]|nr:tetratricopeptide repeat protein [Aestuariibacter sp.]